MNNTSTEYKNVLKGYNLILYFAGSMVMNEPTEECIIDFWTNGKLRNLPVSSSNPRFINAAALLRDSCPEKEKCRKMLSDDYHRLFSQSGLPLAPAFESVYSTEELLSVRSSKVTEFYNAYGWGSKVRGKIPDDHLSLELLFLTQMVEKYLQFEDEPCRREMQKEICRFIDYHILSWLPRWNNDVQEFANSDCYKAIATLIYACTEDIRGLLTFETIQHS